MKTKPVTLLVVSAAMALALLGAGCNKPAESPQPASPGATPTVEVSDVDVTTHVKTALLQDALLKGLDITVITLKGDVRLIGVLDSQAQIDTALKVARAADGVHSLHDELTLKK